MKLAAFLRELGQPVAYYPKLAQVTGGVVANLFLCQMYYWQGKQDDPHGWIYKTQAEIEAETGLSRREQETARQLLRQRNLIQERYKGLPRRLEFWLDEEELENRWAFFLEHQGEKSLLEDNNQLRKQRSTPKSSQSSQTQSLCQAPKNLLEQDLSIMAQTDTIVCPKSPDNNARNRQAIMAESAIIECTKPPDKNAQNAQASMAEVDKQAWRNRAGNLYTENTTEITNRDYNTHPPTPQGHECEQDVPEVAEVEVVEPSPTSFSQEKSEQLPSPQPASSGRGNDSAALDSACEKFEQGIKGRSHSPTYRTTWERDGIKQEFLNWMCLHVMASWTQYKHKTPTPYDAKNWVRNREKEGCHDLVENRYEQMLHEQAHPQAAQIINTQNAVKSAQGYESIMQGLQLAKTGGIFR